MFDWNWGNFGWWGYYTSYVLMPYVLSILQIVIAVPVFFDLDTQNPEWYSKVCLQPKAKPKNTARVIQRYCKSVPRTILNIGVVSLVVGFTIASIADYIRILGVDSYYIWKVLVSVLLSEVFFYTVHRGFHHPSLYVTCHKLHHENPAPLILDAFYGPLPDMIFVNAAFILPPFMVSMTPLQLTLQMVVVTWVNILAHCGHNIPFLFDIARHDAHHEFFECNYGFLGLMDWVFDTFRDPKELKGEKPSYPLTIHEPKWWWALGYYYPPYWLM